MNRSALCAAFLLLTSACGRPAEPVDPSASVQRVEAGDTIRLRMGESVELGDTRARITLHDVQADSRCPVDVTCVWAGDAHIRLEAAPATGSATLLDLHTTLDPKEAVFAGWMLRLIDVEPPRMSTDTVRPQDYSVRLAISRG